MLTARQRRVYEFLKRYIAREGLPPTQAEIAEAFGFTQKAAAQHLHLKAAKGVLEIRRDIPRGIRLRLEPRVRAVAESDFLPLVGRVAAGPAVLATEEIDEMVPISHNATLEPTIIDLGGLKDGSDQQEGGIEIEGLYCGHFHPHTG